MNSTNNVKRSRRVPLARTLVAAIAMSACAIASAQTAGTWMVKGGINHISPDVSSGDMSASSLPGTKADVGSSTSMILSGAYMITDNISAELCLGLPHKHNVYGDGAIKGSGKIGTVESLPPALFAQYRFLDPKARFRPYVGLGVIYAMTRKETGNAALTALTNPGGQPTTFSVGSAWGFAGQIGGSYAINEKWYVDFTASKTFLKQTATFSTGQQIDLRVDPVTVNLSVGYRF